MVYMCVCACVCVCVCYTNTFFVIFKIIYYIIFYIFVIYIDMVSIITSAKIELTYGDINDTKTICRCI